MKNMKNNNVEKKVLIISAIDPTRAYSCIKYLFFKLKAEKIQTECWCRVPNSSRDSYDAWGNKVRTFCKNKITNLPKIRTYYMKLIGLFECFRYRNEVIICHDLFHYRSCCFIKRHFPNTQLIVYFTEIYNNKHSKYLVELQNYFEQNQNCMDLMIECDYKREQYRLLENKVKKPSSTILNTIPMTEVLSFKCVQKTHNERPIIVYSGGVHEKGEFDIILNALGDIEENFEIDFYCFGTTSVIESLRKECQDKLPNKYRLITNQPREIVLSAIYNADIGIVYYDPAYSINTKYAAPTKFFEYISLEIPVVSSGNPSLINLIEKYGLGTYMKENTERGLRDAILELLNSSLKREQISYNEKIAFENDLCYEKQSMDAMVKINSLIKNE